MAAAGRYEFEVSIRCPECGNASVGTASESSEKDHPDFQIEQMPSGFLLVQPSSHQFKTSLHCNCGNIVSLREAT